MTLLVTALVVAAVCVRLGIWQLSRLAERRAYNEAVLSGYERPVVPLDSLSGDSGSIRYRRVSVTGAYDTAGELVVANRPRRGSPGVHVVTPLRREGNDTAVMVVRGWLYAADAANAPVQDWREDSADAAVGYVQGYDAELPGQRSTMQGRILRRMTYGEAAAAVGYPLAPYVVVLTQEGDTVAGAPPRLDPPALGEGSHLSYAFQWFAFAVIAIAGTLVYLSYSSRTRTRQDERFVPP